MTNILTRMLVVKKSSNDIGKFFTIVIRFNYRF